MQKTKHIDFAKLLGFETVCDRISGSIDFQDETVGAKLGAKVGGEVTTLPVTRPKAPAKRLGSG